MHSYRTGCEVEAHETAAARNSERLQVCYFVNGQWSDNECRNRAQLSRQAAALASCRVQPAVRLFVIASIGRRFCPSTEVVVAARSVGAGAGVVPRRADRPANKKRKTVKIT